jgi:dolichol kinase
MNPFAVLNATIMFSFGVLILVYVVKHWNDPKKQQYKYSELTYSIFYFILAVFVLIYLDVEGISQENQVKIQMYLFLGYIVILFWLLPLNLWRESYKCKKNPSLIENDPLTRKYDIYLEKLAEKYANNSKREDVVKDLSRKFLHLVLFSLMVLFHIWAYSIESELAESGITPNAFRNTLYLGIGGLFVFMFSLEDLYRMNYFHCCPDWARNWMRKSLDPRSESWTFISSVPFIQTILVFIFAPVQVFFSAAIVACISDSVASIVGKSFGKHKLTKIGFYPNKSVEGLVGGMVATFIGIMLVFYFYPMAGVALWLVIIIALIGALSFAVIDVWGKFIADNVLNTAIPGLFIWIILIFAI